TIAHRMLADSRRNTSQTMIRLVERLRARLGTEAVYGLQCVAEHRPERASLASGPVLRKRAAKKTRHGQSTAQHPALARPHWLLPQPQPLRAYRSWSQFEGKLELLQGPERIESGWWDGH